MDKNSDRFIKPVCYYASLKNDEMIKQCSSGGIAYALSENWLDDSEDSVVYGVAYSDDFKTAKFIRVSDNEELNKLCGSKYIYPSEMITESKNVFESIYEDLNSKKKVLFFGLPCHVVRLHTFLEKRGIKRTNLLLTVDLICHGPMEATIQTDYINFLEKVYGSNVIDFTVRYKNPDWEHICVRAVFANGKIHIRPLYDTDIGRAFLVSARKCAYRCKFKKENRKSDITIGDYWGVSPDSTAYNSNGTSLAICHSKKGEEVLHSLQNINCGPVDMKVGLQENQPYYFPRVEGKDQKKFEEIYKSKGLHQAVFATRSTLSKLKYYVQLVMGKYPY